MFDESTFHTLDTRLVRTYPYGSDDILPGKIPPDVLKEKVFKHLGTDHPSLILGPALGQDASLIRIGEKVLVASTDPITGSIEDIGWLAVHVNANDVATFGVAPKWFLNSIMLPAGSTPDQLERIMVQIDEAAKSLDITVAGGHTEITDDIEKPIIAGFMLGETSPGEYVTSEGANPGDTIIMTKSAAIEGTSILASEGFDYLLPLVGEETLKKAISLREKISVVAEGLAAFKTGAITAMHDPTEGGIATGIHELCDASRVGFTVYKDRISMHESTREICKSLRIEPYHLISSGSMLITCEAKQAEMVVETLQREGIHSAIIGKIEKDFTKRKIMEDEIESDLYRPITDSLWEGLKSLRS